MTTSLTPSSEAGSGPLGRLLGTTGAYKLASAIASIGKTDAFHRARTSLLETGKTLLITDPQVTDGLVRSALRYGQLDAGLDRPEQASKAYMRATLYGVAFAHAYNRWRNDPLSSNVRVGDFAWFQALGEFGLAATRLARPRIVEGQNVRTIPYDAKTLEDIAYAARLFGSERAAVGPLTVMWLLQGKRRDAAAGKDARRALGRGLLSIIS